MQQNPSAFGSLTTFAVKTPEKNEVMQDQGEIDEVSGERGAGHKSRGRNRSVLLMDEETRGPEREERWTD